MLVDAMQAAPSHGTEIEPKRAPILARDTGLT